MSATIKGDCGGREEKGLDAKPPAGERASSPLLGSCGKEKRLGSAQAKTRKDKRRNTTVKQKRILAKE